MGRFDYNKHTATPMASKPVSFRARLIPGCAWEIVAHCPKKTVDFIEGFKNEEDALAWISGSESVKWIKAQGY
ncbi:MAG: hypothetical protein H0V72_00345 [Bradyrhizobium sp.]|nr:hypothetical protein [Bradyrhizobium sp.]